MRFTVSSANLLSHLQTISRAISSKNQLPILDNFLFRIEGNRLEVTASDLDTTLITTLELDSSEGDGAVALSAKILLDTLKEFSDQPLVFNINDNNLSTEIKTESGSFNSIGLFSDEYPKTPELEEQSKQFSMTAEALASGINKTIFATGNDEIRAILTGINFDIKKEDDGKASITFASSDSHKLIRIINYGVIYTEDEPSNFILPKKAANLLKTILQKENGDVIVKFDSKNICIELENYRMFCRQIEGKYPNYNAIIPKECPYRATLDRQSFMNVLKRVSVFSNQASNLVSLEFSENKVRIYAQDISFSVSAEEELVCSYTGDDLAIGFKSSFLIEMLSNLSSTDVLFELTDSSHAGLLFPVDIEENEDVLMLIMPLMLDNNN